MAKRQTIDVNTFQMADATITRYSGRELYGDVWKTRAGKFMVQKGILPSMVRQLGIPGVPVGLARDPVVLPETEILDDEKTAHKHARAFARRSFTTRLTAGRKT